MNHRHLLRRSGQLLALTIVTVTAVTQFGAGVATAKPVPPPLALIGSDGSVVDTASLITPNRAELAGSSGTGLNGGDGAGFAEDPIIDAGDGPGTSAVWGPDNRQRTSPATGSVQTRSTVQITRTVGNRTQHWCSGWMFGPDTVITAGHCVYNPFDPHYDWIGGTFRVYPGRDASGVPYGPCTVRTKFTVTAWAYGANREYDMGALKLNCNVGNSTGWMGVWHTTDASLADAYVFVRGYPADKPYGTQWWDAGDIQLVRSNQVFYAIDTADGQSGGPVYNHVTGTNCTCVLAIHTAAYTNLNAATRITREVSEWLFYWRNR